MTLSRVLPKEAVPSGWCVYDFHEEFARQQVSWYGTDVQSQEIRTKYENFPLFFLYMYEILFSEVFFSLKLGVGG